MNFPAKKVSEKLILTESKLFQEKKDNIKDYDHILVYPPFRVFYRNDHSDLAPQNLQCTNQEGIPDYIISILHKFIVARLLLIKSFHLKDPLSHGIFYKKGAHFIDLKLKNIPVEHGLTSDRVFNEQHKLLNGTDFQGLSLRIIIHNKLYSKTATPIHELFHLFQYAYTAFNNMWFMEGLGRWVQSIIKESTGTIEKLPETDKELKDLFKKWHDAEFFWNRLTDLCESEHQFNIPEQLIDSQEIVNNQRSGSQFMPVFLKHCQKSTLELIEQEHSRNVTLLDYWTREEKRSANNNIYILRAILATIKDLSPPENNELENFANLIQPICSASIEVFNQPDIQKLMSLLHRYNLANVQVNAQAILYSDYYDCYSNTLSIQNLDLSGQSINDNDLMSLKCVCNIIGNINLSNNPDIANLSALSGLESVEGHLLINNTGIKSTEGIDKLERVKGKLEINNNSNLLEVTGFNKLQVIDQSLQINSNPNLMSISAFKQLQQIKKGPLLIDECKKLNDIDGFQQLKDAQGIRLFKLAIDNADFLRIFFQTNKEYKHFLKITYTQLHNIKFLQGIISVNSSLYLQHNQLTTLAGLEQLETVGASFSLSNNQIESLSPLLKLKSVNGLLGLSNNKLTSLHGLENLSFIKVTQWGKHHRSLLLNNNPALKDISALSNLKGHNNQLIIAIGNNHFDKKPNIHSAFAQNKIKILGPSQNVLNHPMFNDTVIQKLLFVLNKCCKDTVFKRNNIFHSDSYDVNTRTLKVDTLTIDKLNQNELAALDILENIDGDLIINAEQLEKINGFNRLRRVNSIKILNMPLLSEINGFNLLEELNNLEINNNPKLQFIGGFLKFFSAIGRISGSIKIEFNKQLTSVSFLQGITAVGSSFYLHHNGLKNLNGLEHLTEVGASLSFSSNQLQSLEQLLSLRKVGGMLGVAYNQLSSLTGLENLNSIGITKWNQHYRSLAIQGNNYLQDISAISSLVSDTNYCIVILDKNNNYRVLPDTDAPFYQQSLVCIDEQKAVITNSIFSAYKPPEKVKILFYDTWNKALNKHDWLEAHFLKFEQVSEVIDYAKRHGITYLYGQLYNAQKFLYMNQDKLLTSGLKFIANNFNVVRLLLNKRSFYEHMLSHGFNNMIPEYYPNVDKIKYPCIIKQVTAANGETVRLIKSKEELGIVADDEVINEYIVGDVEYASNVFYKNGKILLDITYKKSYNRSYYILNQDTKYKMLNEKIENPYLHEFTQMLNSFYPNKEGILLCCIDFKIQNGVPKIFEINVRLGYTLARGTDDFHQMFKLYLNEVEKLNG